MDITTRRPLRGPKYRSRIFQEYLLRQTPKRRAEISAAEYTFTYSHHQQHSAASAAERDYHYDMRPLDELFER